MASTDVNPSGMTTATGSNIPLLNLAVSSPVPADQITSGMQLPTDGALSSRPPGSRLAQAVVLLGALCGNTISFGWGTSTGFFIDYYRTHQFAGESDLAVSWLAGFGFFFLYFVSLPLQLLHTWTPIGPRPIMVVGAFLNVVALGLLSLTTELYQVEILQGFLAPLGSSMVFNGTIPILSAWFKQKVIFAIATTSLGSSLGGLSFPAMIVAMLPERGYRDTMQVMMCIIAVLSCICFLCCVPPEGWKHKPARVNALKLFTQTQFIATVIGSAFYVCGYYTILAFIVSIGRARGIQDAEHLLEIVNGCSAFGRIAAGFFSKSRGGYNTLILFTLMAWVLTLGLFAVDLSERGTMIYCAIWGFFSASSISLLPAIIFAHSPIPEISVRIGFSYFLMSFGVLFGPPIGAALVQSTGDYRGTINFCGAIQAVGWCFWVFARFYETGLPSVDIV